MKQPKRDITILLATLLLFSISIGLVHTTKKPTIKTVIDVSDHIDETKSMPPATSKSIDEPLDNYSPEQVIEYMDSLVEAESAKGIGKVLTQLETDKIKKVLDLLCSKKESNLTPDQIAAIIVHLAHELPDAQKKQELFDYAAANDCVKKGMPLLVIAAEFAYADIIDALKKWMANNPENTLIHDALIALVKNNSSATTAKLLAHNFTIDQAILDDALWHAVDQAAASDFVSILKEYGADVNYAVNNKTLLMRATELAQRDTVRALLDAGAKAELLLDPQVGTALQFALDNNATEIELLLRNAGAHE